MSPDQERRAAIAKIHIAKKDLALQDDSYCSILKRITGKESTKFCTAAQLQQVLMEFRRLGWKAKPKKGARPLSPNAKVRLIYALWNELKPLLDDATDTTLRAFVRKQTKGPAHPNGLDAPEFLNSMQADKVIGGLQGWLENLRGNHAEGETA